MNRIFVDSVGLELVEIASAKAGRLAPLVFLHEGLGSVAMWRDWPARLCAASGRAGWVYSRRGYGQSDSVPDVRGQGRLLPDYMHQEAWTVLPGLLKALQVVAPVLVGHSDGGSIAMLHASRFQVAAVIAMAPHVIVERVSIESIKQAKTAFEAGDLRERLARYHADVDGAFWQWNDIWLSDGFSAFDIRADCQRIQQPILAIQGMDDVYGTMRQIDEISPMGPIARQRLANCGHSAHRDQADLSLRLIADFLKTAD